MIADKGCAHVRDLAAEVALGVADGEDRALVFAHTADCSECRAFVAELTSTVDAVLLLAPSKEPPPDFEARLMKRLSRGRKGEIRARVLSAAAALVVGLLVATGAVWMGTATDRRLADGYRSTLAEARGEYFRAVPMRDADGLKVGNLFAYQGRPSWIYGVVDAPLSSLPIRGVVVAEDGTRVPVDSISVSGSHISFGMTLPFPIRDVRSVEVIDASGSTRLTARLSAE
jgi:hypothetical protein